MNFIQQYIEELKQEQAQFLFLCGDKDIKILVSEVNEKEITEHVRLACIAIVLGFNKLFMKIVAHAETHFNIFMANLKEVGENFNTIESWINEFIENMEYPEAKKLIYDFWLEQKETLDLDNFNIRQFLK